MLKIKIPQMYETKEQAKKERNQFINMIVVLLIGIYGIHQNDEILNILGWILIILSSLVLWILHISPTLFFYLGEITYKLSKKSRKLHYKMPQSLKDGNFDALREKYHMESDIAIFKNIHQTVQILNRDITVVEEPFELEVRSYHGINEQ